MSYLTAHRALQTAITAAWLVGAPLVSGGPASPVLLYDNLDAPADTPALPYGILRIANVDSAQYTLGEVGGRLFSRAGVVGVEIRVPAGTGRELVDGLAQVIVDALEGATIDSVRIRHPRLQEIGGDAHLFRVDVVADFEYEILR